MIENFYNDVCNNKNVLEVLRVFNCNNKLLSDSKYKDLSVYPYQDTFIINTNIKEHSEMDVYKIGVEKTGKIQHVSFGKNLSIKDKKDITGIEYNIYFSHNNELGSIEISFHAKKARLILLWDEDFNLMVSKNPRALQYDTIKKMRELFDGVENTKNKEIGKNFLEYFLYQNPISSDIKDLIELNSDININNFEVYKDFGYDFRTEQITNNKKNKLT